MARRTLPVRLHAAYRWTDAASELDELACLEGAALIEYCQQSAANAAEHNESDEITEASLLGLASWLQEGEVSR